MSKKPKVFLFVKYVADKMELCDHHTYDPIHVWCFWCAMSFGRSKPLLPLSIPGNIHLASYLGSVPLPHTGGKRLDTKLVLIGFLCPLL